MSAQRCNGEVFNPRLGWVRCKNKTLNATQLCRFHGGQTNHRTITTKEQQTNAV